MNGMQDLEILRYGIWEMLFKRANIWKEKSAKLSQMSITSFPFDLTEDADIFLDPVIRLFLPCPILMPLLSLVPVKMRESETLKETILERTLGFRISQ